ncbi:MAG: hypothetical protein P4N59_04755 [Negativicutes bacterium]|nr:hypothetical protein [Negativicutes bacterium]
MKLTGPLLIAASLSLAAHGRSQDAADAATVANVATANAADDNKPYSTIVARNMFGLLPVPPPVPVDAEPPKDPPPKITPNGIMTIFGRNQALFKVANKPKPGQPAKEDSFVLSEGERESDITVVKINKQDSIITFDNHGTIQELPLVPAKDTGGGPGGPGNSVAGSHPGPMTPAERAQMIRQRMNPGSSSAVNPGFNNPASSGQPNMGASSTFQPQEAQQSIEDKVMSAAQNMAQIELNRIATQEAVDQGLMPPLPPTMLTPPDATAAGGSPLIAPNEPVTTTTKRK